MEKIYQPATTDITIQGMMIARNAMRIKLWVDTAFAHKFICHPGENCPDGCDKAAIPSRLALYQSPLEY